MSKSLKTTAKKTVAAKSSKTSAKSTAKKTDKVAKKSSKTVKEEKPAKKAKKVVKEEKPTAKKKTSKVVESKPAKKTAKKPVSKKADNKATEKETADHNAVRLAYKLMSTEPKEVRKHVKQITTLAEENGCEIHENTSESAAKHHKVVFVVKSKSPRSLRRFEKAFDALSAEAA